MEISATLDTDEYHVIKLVGPAFESGALLGFNLNLDFVGNIVPGGIVCVAYLLKSYHDVTSVSQLSDVSQFSSYSPVRKHTMNTNPLRWKCKRRATFREGQYLILVLSVKSDVDNLAGTIWGSMKYWTKYM